MIVADVADYRWLTGDEAARLLEAAAGETDPLALATRLRKSLSAARAALIAEQVRLRRRATAKFPAAAEMFFTDRGLQQATDADTAAYKARRFAGGGSLADLCCGIGGDLLAIGRENQAVGYDADAITALLAEANCRTATKHENSAFRAIAINERAESKHVADVAAWHIDPDRRPAGRRTTQVELHEPSWETIEQLLVANPNAAVKLAPGAEPPPAWRARAEWEWLGRDGECKQLCGWFGSLSSRQGLRCATVVRGAESRIDHLTIYGTADEEQAAGALPAPADRVGRYVYEPDAAVLAAHLIGTLAAHYEMQPLALGCAYLTADVERHDGLFSTFEVLDQMPFDLRKVRAWLAERGIPRVEIKKRGVDVDIERLQQLLRRPTTETIYDPVTLILARRGDRVTALFSRRIPPPAA